MREVLARVWPGLALVLVGAVGFVVLLDAVRDQDDLWVLDDPLLAWMVAQRSPVATTVLTVVTTVSGPYVLPVLVALGCALWAWRSGTWWEPGMLAGAMVLSTLVSTVLKAVVARPRPPDASMVVAGVERSFSFPSGHTIGAATLVLVGGYLVWHRHHDGRRGGRGRPEPALPRVPLPHGRPGGDGARGGGPRRRGRRHTPARRADGRAPARGRPAGGNGRRRSLKKSCARSLS